MDKSDWSGPGGSTHTPEYKILKLEQRIRDLEQQIRNICYLNRLQNG